MNKPKVMFVGGPDVDYRIDLMKRLSSQFRLIVAGSDPSLAERFEGIGIRYYYYPLRRSFSPLSDFISLLKLVSIFREEKPDIVHTFDTKPSVIGRIAAKLAGAPFTVGTITGLGTIYLKGSVYYYLLRVINELSQWVACRVSDFTVFYNQLDAQYYLNRRLVEKHKAVVIRGSGVETNRFSPQAMDTGAKETLKRDLGIAPDQKVVSLVARLVRSKGIKLYWNAAHAVRESGTNACFLLIGPQDHESMDGLSLEEIDSMSQDIYWLGYRSDIENIFAISDVFVLPSGREGLPRVLAEAAAAGLPLIASNVPGCSEVVEDGVNGFLFAPGGGEDLIDAIKFLLNNETLRRSYGEASRRIALERLDIEVISKSISELYAKRKNHRVRDHVTRSAD